MKQIYVMMQYVALLMLLCTCTLQHALSLGTKEIEFIIPSTDRTITAEVYYPTNQKTDNKQIEQGVWVRQAFIKDAPLSSDKKEYPLVIFSHGFTGDRFHHTWLTEALVQNGYIVAAIDHTYNTSYDHNDFFTYSSMWQRPCDISALIDYLLKCSSFAHSIDKHRIAVGGFSLGGTTALWISGIKGDPQAFKEAMNVYARWSDWPNSISKRAAQVDWLKAKKSYYDSRVKAVFSFAPDLGKGFKSEGIAQAKIPTLIIVGDKDQITPSETNAAHFYRHLKKPSQLIILEGAEHFAFVNNCSDLGKKILPPLCRDTPTDRAKMHDIALKHVLSFLSTHLAPL